MATSFNPYTDPKGGVPPLWAYVFLRVTTDAALTGYFVDVAGRQMTELQEFTISSTAVTFADLYGADLPDGAVGFVGALADDDIYVGLGGLADGTIPSGMEPEAGYPVVETAVYVSFGRVA